MPETTIPNIDRYIAYLSGARVPVLRRTVRELTELRENEENVTGRQLASVVLQDPLMTLRVLIHLEEHRRQSQNHDITTVERAIMMLGVSPFFKHFSDLPTVEERLAQHPRALVGVLRVIGRAKSATRFARDWALMRHDLDVDEIAVAALLHEAAEILLWCFAPAQMLKVDEVMLATPGLRSAVAQRSVLGIVANDLQQGLVRAWHLPELLITLMADSEATNPRVRNVILACDLARHAAKGWQDPALPDDYAAIARLLRISPESLLRRLNVPEEFWPPLESLGSVTQF